MKIKANQSKEPVESSYLVNEKGYIGPVVREHSKRVTDVLQLLRHNSIQRPG